MYSVFPSFFSQYQTSYMCRFLNMYLSIFVKVRLLIKKNCKNFQLPRSFPVVSQKALTHFSKENFFKNMSITIQFSHSVTDTNIICRYKFTWKIFVSADSFQFFSRDLHISLECLHEFFFIVLQNARENR